MSRSKIITLCRELQVDIFNVPEDFDEQIIEAFKAYTKGTSHDYTYVDKLGFIDWCVERINGYEDDFEKMENLVKQMIADHFEFSPEIIDGEDTYNLGVMVYIYRTARNRTRLEQFYGTDDHHEYDRIQQLMCRIIKTVMNFEWE